MRSLLTPEPMQRTLIVSSKSHQPAVIDALHKLRVAHFIDYQEGQGGEFEGFKLGAPLPQAGPAAERLVRVRAILRHVGLEGAEPGKAVPAREVEAKLGADLDRIEQDVSRAFEARERLETSLQETRDLETKLAPLAALPLRLEDYRGYDTLHVFVGRADAGFEPPAGDALLVRSEAPEGVFALFVPKARAAAVQEALYKHGFAEVEVPPGEGSPAERIAGLEAERAQIKRLAEQAAQDLQRLAATHRDLLLAAEEHLAIIVEKAEAPLSFASSEHAFLVDAWIPASQVNVVEATLRQATAGSVHYQVLESARDHSQAHAKHEDGAHADAAYDAGPEGSHHHDGHEEPPTKFDNPRATRRFEWFTELFAVPRYDEIDPTTVFAIFFPLFFGFMVGDLGLGIAIAGIGWLLVRKLHRVDGMRQLGTAFLVAGLVAAAFGGIVFKDALGIPFGTSQHMLDEVPKWAAENPGVVLDAAHPTCADVYRAVGEATWGCLLGRGPVRAEPLLAKTTDIGAMLLLSLTAAFVHLALGLLFGLRNERAHGAKHVAAKVGYLILLLGFFPAAVAVLYQPGTDTHPGLADWLGPVLGYGLPKTTAFLAAGVAFVVGGVILGWAEGVAGVLEIPSMLSNILSYLRLGAIGIAKGAMATAFNGLTLVIALKAMNGGLTAGSAAVVVLALVGFVVIQLLLLVLGILSGGIQALRLNFVEFFTKFYKGGGTPYRPFGRARRATAPSSTTP